MASVSDDNKIKIWELKQGRLGWTVFGHEGNVRTLEFNEKGDYFATGGDDKLVMIWSSNFDRDLNNSGRGDETNFKEKANGTGLQPLFKSNKLSSGLPESSSFAAQNQEK
jgi:centriolar protein POC1